jgi:hypothetical protein
MKKLSLFIALAMLASSIVLSPLNAKAQDDKQTEFERGWYDTCYVKKDAEKCYALSKELIVKYPSSTYAKNAQTTVKNTDLNKAWERFQEALKAYYNPPQDAPKLEALFAAGEDYLKIQPGQQYVIGQLALAGANGVLGQTYKNLDKVKGYAEKALKAFEPTTPPEGWEKSEYEPLRDIVMAQMNQYLGFQLIENKGDSEQALAYLAKATAVKGKDGAGWKDPNNYWLRSTVFSAQYVALRAEYDKMTDEEKTGESGKAILTKVNDLLDNKLIPEYARVLATANKPEAKGLYDAAKPQFDAFWKYRTDAPDKAADYVKNYSADPTIAAVPIPAKAETATDINAPTGAPTVGAAPVKLSASGGGAAATAAPGSKTSAGNGAKSTEKATPAKGKSTRKPTRKPRR